MNQIEQNPMHAYDLRLDIPFRALVTAQVIER